MRHYGCAGTVRQRCNNALLITNSASVFITTLAMTLMAQGLMYLISSIGNNGIAANINFQDATLKYIGTGMIGPIPGYYYHAVIFHSVWVILAKTGFGMKVGIGGNAIAQDWRINADDHLYSFVNSAIVAGWPGTPQPVWAGVARHCRQTSLPVLQLQYWGHFLWRRHRWNGRCICRLAHLKYFSDRYGCRRPFWVQVFTELFCLALTADFVTQARFHKAQAAK